MKLTVNQVSIAYSDSGVGLPLVLIHGYPLSRKMWDPQVKALASQSRVIAVDLRGHGESEAVSGNYSMELFADDIAGVLDGLKVERKAVICGLSMGGYVALAFMRKYASRSGWIDPDSNARRRRLSARASWARSSGGNREDQRGRSRGGGDAPKDVETREFRGCPRAGE